MKVNMQSMSIESHNGIFEGTFKVYIKNHKQLDKLLAKLKKVEGVQSVKRVTG